MTAPLPDPMPEMTPRLFADEHGIWREDKRGRRFDIEWAEVSRVSGHSLDGITETYLCVELDFEHGNSIELYSHWSGFQSVIAGIASHLPGINPAWFQNVMRLDVADAPVECWRRTEPTVS
jgi:hypothetical protein